jgi:hypothetical protein
VSRISAIRKRIGSRFNFGRIPNVSNYVLMIMFNVQQVWLYFEFPGSLSWFVAFMGAWSIFFAWQLSHQKGRLAAIGAALISISALMTVIFAFASIYEKLGILSTSTGKVSHDPTICLYFSMVTITTLGYGDFVPSPPARLFAGSEAVAGLFLVAALIAVFARVFNRAESNTIATPGA